MDKAWGNQRNGLRIGELEFIDEQAHVEIDLAAGNGLFYGESTQAGPGIFRQDDHSFGGIIT